ncbi:unnamed protein product [Caenorhabditis brenneri]
MNLSLNAMEEVRHGQKRKRLVFSETSFDLTRISVNKTDDAKQAKIMDLLSKTLSNTFCNIALPRTYVQFEKFQRGCNVSTSDAPMEFHQNDFIDEALTTIMRIIRVPNFQSHSMCLSQYCVQSEHENPTWSKCSTILLSCISRENAVFPIIFGYWRTCKRDIGYSEFSQTEYPNNPETVEILVGGVGAIVILHGKWINIEQLELLKIQNITIQEVSLTDIQINRFLRNRRDSGVASDWKQLDIHFNRAANLDIVLEGIEVTDEDEIRPADVIHQWSFNTGNGKKCTACYANYVADFLQFGFEFRFGN